MRFIKYFSTDQNTEKVPEILSSMHIHSQNVFIMIFCVHYI